MRSERTLHVVCSMSNLSAHSLSHVLSPVVSGDAGRAALHGFVGGVFGLAWLVASVVGWVRRPEVIGPAPVVDVTFSVDMTCS